MNRLRVGVNLLYLKPGRVGGTEEYVRRLLAALDAEATDQVELTLFVNRRFSPAHAALAETHDTVVAPVSGDRPVTRIAIESTWLARETARRPLDVVHHVANTVPHVVTGPTVVSMHDLQPIVRPQDFGRVKAAYLRARLGPSARKARMVATLSEYVRGLVINRFDIDPSRVVVVPGPLDPVPQAAPDEAPTDVQYFVYPAITHPHKNHVTLIRAFADVVRTNPEVSLVLTGGPGGNEAEVRGEIDRLALGRRVRRTGRIPRCDLDRLVRGAVGLTFPSRHEGYGLPVAEAMALGCPVIASDTTALPEVVGDAGVLVDPGDVSGWTDAMSRFLDDEALRSRLAAAGRRRVAWLTPAETARRMVAAYRSAIATG